MSKNHPDIKESDFIDKFTPQIDEESAGLGLYSLSDEEIWKLLEKTGYLYGKIISTNLFEEKPL